MLHELNVYVLLRVWSVSLQEVKKVIQATKLITFLLRLQPYGCDMIYVVVH